MAALREEARFARKDSGRWTCDLGLATGRGFPRTRRGPAPERGKFPGPIGERGEIPYLVRGRGKIPPRPDPASPSLKLKFFIIILFYFLAIYLLFNGLD